MLWQYVQLVPISRLLPVAVKADIVRITTILSPKIIVLAIITKRTERKYKEGFE